MYERITLAGGRNEEPLAFGASLCDSAATERRQAMTRVRWTGVALACSLAACVWAGGVAAQPAPNPPDPTSPAPADPAFEAAKAAFEALPEAERKAIQDALV